MVESGCTDNLRSCGNAQVLLLRCFNNKLRGIVENMLFCSWIYMFLWLFKPNSAETR